MCNFCDPNLVTIYFYELTYFLDWMKNTLLFICSTNIVVRLLPVNIKNCLNNKIRKCATPFKYLYWKCDPIIVNLVVKMRSHPVVRPHWRLIRKPLPPTPPSQATCILVVHNSSANIKSKLLVIQHQWKMVIETLDDKLNKDMRRINIVPVSYKVICSPFDSSSDNFPRWHRSAK